MEGCIYACAIGDSIEGSSVCTCAHADEETLVILVDEQNYDDSHIIRNPPNRRGSKVKLCT